MLNALSNLDSSSTSTIACLSLVSSCYSHRALTSSISAPQARSLKESLTTFSSSESMWVCREALLVWSLLVIFLAQICFLIIGIVLPGIAFIRYVHSLSDPARVAIERFWRKSQHQTGASLSCSSQWLLLGFTFEDILFFSFMTVDVPLPDMQSYNLRHSCSRYSTKARLC